MKRPFSPLIWLCAVSAAALGALTISDPNGVYADYVTALVDGAPAVAAVFTAAQDGVYPWSAETPPGEPSVSAFSPISGTVTGEEVAVSVGESPITGYAPSVEGKAPAEAAQPPVKKTFPDAGEAPAGFAVPVKPAAPAPEAEVEDPAEEPAAPVRYASGFVTVDASWFDDAVFIGDSHIEGFCDYAGLHNATYYYKRGLSVWSVLDKAFVSGKLTVPQALSRRQFGKIYIMLGTNEIGSGTTESYAAQYGRVVGELRALQPDALIYIQAIFHTTKTKSDGSIYNNDTINARNAAISRLADGEHVFFVDCNPVFDDENGALTAKYSGDGVHVMAPYYTMWRDYLLGFGKAVRNSQD